MEKKSNIIIADESALHLYLHTSDLDVFGAMPTWDNPLEESFSVPDTTSFNADHPLYGGLPIVLLVGRKDARRRSKRVVPRVCSPDVPMGSFVKMRNGLYVASPELTFVRMGNRVSEFQLAEIGMNLCGGYFVNQDTGDIDDRSRFLTSPGDLAAYARRASHLRGSKKAAAALRWIIPNSGSPAETKMKLQYLTV